MAKGLPNLECKELVLESLDFSFDRIADIIIERNFEVRHHISAAKTYLTYFSPKWMVGRDWQIPAYKFYWRS